MLKPTKEDITRILANHRKHCIAESPQLKNAAVLIPLFLKNDEFHVLLMKRSDKVEYHKSQISFPGGGCDESDVTMCATALREAAEEVGLRPEDAEILGELDDCLTITSGFRVVPFVAYIPYPYSFHPNTHEVAELLETPLSLFLDPANYASRPVIYGNDFFIEYRDNLIWGATARMLWHFSELLREDAAGSTLPKS